MSAVVDMWAMFYGASAFNQDLNSWVSLWLQTLLN